MQLDAMIDLSKLRLENAYKLLESSRLFIESGDFEFARRHLANWKLIIVG